MISEGTNIPRLRVCCYLSLVTTELYFRQVLGRVLRAQNNDREMGYFITPAHPRLLEFASRVAEEVPHCAVLNSSNIDDLDFTRSRILIGDSSLCFNPQVITKTVAEKEFDEGLRNDLLPIWYASTIDSFGRFRQKVFML